MKFKETIKHLIFIMLALLFASCDADDNKYNWLEDVTPKSNYVMTDGKSATIISKYDKNWDIVIRLAKVMKNNLYSIKEVYLAANSNENLSTKVSTNKRMLCKLNDSDMIGPINVKRPISGDSWIGSNHLYLNQQSGIKSAITNNYSIYADGTPINNGAAYANVVTINVENTIFDPDVTPINGTNILTSPLIIENITYSISGGEIMVEVKHKYLKDVHVNTYYGMQSIFKGVQFITAQGGYSDWKRNPTAGNVLRIKKAQAPNFNRFSQKANDNIYCQNTILLTHDLGTHKYIKDDGDVFIWSENKAYHVLIQDKDITKNSILSWKGIYNWKKPIVDDEYNYIYEFSDKNISITAKKAYHNISVPAPEDALNTIFEITESDNNITIEREITTDLNLSSQGEGSICGYLINKKD